MPWDSEISRKVSAKAELFRTCTSLPSRILDASRKVGRSPGADEPFVDRRRRLGEAIAFPPRGSGGELGGDQIAVARLEKIENLASALDRDEFRAYAEPRGEQLGHLPILGLGGADTREALFAKRGHEDPKDSPVADLGEISAFHVKVGAVLHLRRTRRQDVHSDGDENGALHLNP